LRTLIALTRARTAGFIYLDVARQWDARKTRSGYTHRSVLRPQIEDGVWDAISRRVGSCLTPKAILDVLSAKARSNIVLCSFDLQKTGEGRARPACPKQLLTHCRCYSIQGCSVCQASLRWQGTWFQLYECIIGVNKLSV